MMEILARLAPDQAGALWIGFLVAFLVFGDHHHPLAKRNLALLGLLAIAPFLYDILDVSPRLQAWSLRAVFFLTGAMAAWSVQLSRWAWADWRPNLPVPALRVLTLCMVVVGTATVFTRAPDDAGVYTNLGAQRWAETGRLPYGDRMLKGPDAPAYGAAATYGPILYALHLPYQMLLGPRGNDAGADPRLQDYQWPPRLATELTTWTLFLLGLWLFFLIGRAYTDQHRAWAMVAVLASLPYFVGLGGERFVVGGLRFVSHIAPMTATLLAFLMLRRPAVAGALLAVAAGVLYYPAFFFPIWLAWYWYRGAGAGKFLMGFSLAGLALALGVVAFTHAGPGENAVSLFLQSTLEHQEGTGPQEYGASAFSFWAYQPGLASIFQRPLIGDSSLFKLSFLLFATFCGVLSLLSKGRSPAQLAALTAAAGAAVQLWKTHATGSYVEWYLPFLMIALFVQSTNDDGGSHAASGEPSSARAK